MPFATARDGVKLYYEEIGDGPPILFIHEFAGDWRAGTTGQPFQPAASLHRLFGTRLSAPTSRRKKPAIRRISRVTTRWRCSIISVSTTRISWAFRWAASRRRMGIAYADRALSLTIGCGYGAEPARRLSRAVAVCRRKFRDRGAADFAEEGVAVPAA